MTTEKPRAPRVSKWRALLDSPDAIRTLGLDSIYAADRDLAAERRDRIASVLARYQELFGDDPVRLYRAPGRINLRGMHVDTHGGWLNLMTHQREILVVSGESPDGDAHVVNTNPAYGAVDMAPGELPSPPTGRPWSEFINSGTVRGRLTALPGHWRNYLEGAWLRARHAFPDRQIGGLRMVVDSNLPEGTALSSSAALCVALLQAWFGWHGIELDRDPLILAAQDAEWYTGSRCGTCDQAAIVLGRPNAMIHATLYPKDFTTGKARTIPFPDGLRVLVINSYTTRSISGAEKVNYTTNRFAYSMAMEIFRQTLRAAGIKPGVVSECDRFSRISAEALGGPSALYHILEQVPAAISLEELRGRFKLPDLDAEFQRYFGDLPAGAQPRTIGLRGPLLYGIAESERARYFAKAIEAGEYAHAGQLMTSGHDGDRRIRPDGQPVQHRVDDAYLHQMAACGTPIEQCPGDYRASSPALDALVDAALAHGALGASLTGAGIAGAVLALCRADDAPRVADGVREALVDPDYARVAGLPVPLTPGQLAHAVVENRATAGAGEIHPRD